MKTIREEQTVATVPLNSLSPGDAYMYPTGDELWLIITDRFDNDPAKWILTTPADGYSVPFNDEGSADTQVIPVPHARIVW